MPRPPKGPRLWLRPARPEKNQQAVWIIRDGPAQISTGCPPERLRGPEGAEAKLAAYIASKWTPSAGSRTGDPAQILIADVLAYYARERAPKTESPRDTSSRLLTLGDWWGDKVLSDIKFSSCDAYVRHRTAQGLRQAKRGAALDKRVSVSTARRELVDLSAAIGFYAKEFPLDRRPVVSLPPEAESQREALTREQAARLLKAAMGYRLDVATGKWTRLSKSACANRAHLRRFIILGLYTGSRPGVYPELLWHESATNAWADLEQETIFRRGRQVRDKATKRRPLVRMPPRLVAHMRRWRAADAKLQAELQKDDPTFTLSSVLHHGGAPLAGRVRRGFASCVRDAGLSADITPHWMRHTCCTWLMERGVDLWEAAAYAGMSTKTLEAVYGHHRPTHQSAARRALG